MKTKKGPYRRDVPRVDRDGEPLIGLAEACAITGASEAVWRYRATLGPWPRPVRVFSPMLWRRRDVEALAASGVDVRPTPHRDRPGYGRDRRPEGGRRG